MKAKLAPLKGKYYGTRVIIGDTLEFQGGYIQIWVMGNHKPSRRELEGYELRDGKWMLAETEPDGTTWNYEYEISDTHYETETSLKIAELLVEAINQDDN